jgi:hypothetical protein
MKVQFQLNKSLKQIINIFDNFISYLFIKFKLKCISYLFFVFLPNVKLSHKNSIHKK